MHLHLHLHWRRGMSGMVVSHNRRCTLCRVAFDDPESPWMEAKQDAKLRAASSGVERECNNNAHFCEGAFLPLCEAWEPTRDFRWQIALEKIKC